MMTQLDDIRGSRHQLPGFGSTVERLSRILRKRRRTVWPRAMTVGERKQLYRADLAQSRIEESPKAARSPGDEAAELERFRAALYRRGSSVRRD